MVDLNKYMDFVKEVTPDESNMTSFMHEHMNKLETERNCPTTNDRCNWHGK